MILRKSFGLYQRVFPAYSPSFPGVRVWYRDEMHKGEWRGSFTILSAHIDRHGVSYYPLGFCELLQDA
jgi:hypothetical protein